jgi:hypothetical protein
MLGKHSRIVFISIAMLLVGNLGRAFGQSAGLPPAEADAKSRLMVSPRHGEWVVVDAGGGNELDAWVSYPERSDSAPVVLVVHDFRVDGLDTRGRGSARRRGIHSGRPRFPER